MIRVVDGVQSWTGFLMLPHLLTNVEIQKHYQNQPTFKVVYSQINLPNTIEKGVYVINLDE